MAVETKRITFQISLSISRTQAIMAGVLALLCVHPTDLATENLTLTTYYPSPYGVYQNLRSTQASYFSTGAGGVGVGTTNIGTRKFQVNGSSAFIGGNVGIDVTNPGSRLGINGGVSIGNAYAQTASPSNGMIVQGGVGIGQSNPTTPPGGGTAVMLDVQGRARVANYLYVEDSGCSAQTFSAAGWHNCGGGQFATWVPGIYQEGYQYANQHEVYDERGWQMFTGDNGQFLCCTI